MHFFPLLYLEAEWREMEQRQTGEKAGGSFFFLNGMNVSGMLRRERKESKGWREGGRRVEGANPHSALGWRVAREELADFGNPSFINVKPSSAECRLTDITELLTTDCL